MHQRLSIQPSRCGPLQQQCASSSQYKCHTILHCHGTQHRHNRQCLVTGHLSTNLLGSVPQNTQVLRVAAVPDWDYDFDKNPQNTQNPQVMPSPSLSPHEAVTVQMQAISNNDHPWDNHGGQTMYEFAEDCGSMERSRYFGFSKDLYHLDHFLGAIKTACGPLVDCKSFTILEGPPDNPIKPLERLPAGMEAVYVAVQDSKGADGGVFELRLVQRDYGLKAGCWMTKSCLKVK